MDHDRHVEHRSQCRGPGGSGHLGEEPGNTEQKLQTALGSHVTVQSRLRVTQDGQDCYASVTVDGQEIFERDWSTGLANGVAAEVGEPVHDGGGGRVEIRER
jgi:hypothetical protein